MKAVVTGAGSGLGRAFCLAIVQRGGSVVASDIDLAAARETAENCGLNAHAVRCDVTRFEEVEALAAEADTLLGGVDTIVNNAGVGLAGRIGEASLADWKWLLDVNLWGVIHGLHAFVPRIRKQGRGSVINVASAAGLASMPLMAAYNASKAAVVAISETLYAESVGENLSVTVVCPMFVKTNIAKTSRGGMAWMIELMEKMMDESRVTAADVARISLDACEKGQLYALTHSEGRWLWRLKRLAPQWMTGQGKAYAQREARKRGLDPTPF